MLRFELSKSNQKQLKSELAVAFRLNNLRLYREIQALLWLGEGRSLAEIAELSGTGVRNLYIWIWAFLRIEKFRMGLLVLIVSVAFSIPIQMMLPFPWGMFGAIIFTIFLPIYFIRKWSEEWNAKLSTMGSEKKDTTEYVRKDDSSIELLKKRYAMGEISKEDFEKKKKDLENS